jgi:hypothetical protein
MDTSPVARSFESDLGSLIFGEWNNDFGSWTNGDAFDEQMVHSAQIGGYGFEDLNTDPGSESIQLATLDDEPDLEESSFSSGQVRSWLTDGLWSDVSYPESTLSQISPGFAHSEDDIPSPIEVPQNKGKRSMKDCLGAFPKDPNVLNVPKRRQLPNLERVAAVRKLGACRLCKIRKIQVMISLLLKTVTTQLTRYSVKIT